MYHRIMELLVLLMDEFGSGLPRDQADTISADLVRRGYTEQEISAAFYWLHRRFRSRSAGPSIQPLDVQEPSETSFRVLNPFERRCFSSDAFGYLLRLLNLKLLNQRELEQVIERILLLDLAPAGLDDVKLIAQTVLFEEGALGASFEMPLGPASLGDTCH